MSRIRPFRIGPAAMAAAVLALIAVGCNDDDASCPTVSGGAIEGIVLGGGKPVQAVVAALSCHSDPMIQAATHTDSTGRYELPLARGEYFVSVREDTSRVELFYAGDGLARVLQAADTVRIEATPIQIDLTAGALTVRLQCPPDLEGERLRCRIRGEPGNVSAHLDPRVLNGFVECRFALVPPGTYLADLMFLRGISYWLPYGDRLSAETIPVAAGEVTSYAVTLPAPGHIQGTIRGSWQTMGMQAPQVFACDASVGTVASAEVSSTGEFSVPLFVPGPMRLQVQSPTVSTWVGGDEFATAMVFDVSLGETISGVSMVESGILCQLEREYPGTFTTARLSLVDDRGRSLFEQSVYSNPIPLPNLHRGTYYLEIRADDPWSTWLPQWYDGQDSLSTATPIVISTDGEVVTTTVLLLEGGKITGAVFQSDGTPAENPQIYFGPAADSTQVAYAPQRSGLHPSGAFAVLRLRTGDYKVGVLLQSPSRISWYPGTTSWDSAAVISVPQGSEVLGITWQLPE